MIADSLQWNIWTKLRGVIIPLYPGWTSRGLQHTPALLSQYKRSLPAQGGHLLLLTGFSLSCLLWKLPLAFASPLYCIILSLCGSFSLTLDHTQLFLFIKTLSRSYILPCELLCWIPLQLLSFLPYLSSLPHQNLTAAFTAPLEWLWKSTVTWRTMIRS